MPAVTTDGVVQLAADGVVQLAAVTDVAKRNTRLQKKTLDFKENNNNQPGKKKKRRAYRAGEGGRYQLRQEGVVVA